MATWKDLSNFTYSELQEMNLTYQDLREMPIEEILVIAQRKLARFQAFSPEQQGPMSKVVPLLEAILTGVAANLATDMLQSLEWKQLLLEAIRLLNNIMPK